ncbi:MAG: thioredoxin family protein [Betaproteobacteria bacterium]
MTTLALLGSAEAMERLAASEPSVLVTFTGPRCIICKRLAPMLETVVREAGAALASAKVDAEALPEVSERYEIRSLPTTLLFRNGTLADRITGFATAGALRAWLAKNGVTPVTA